MEAIIIHDKKFIPFLSAEKIASAIEKIAKEIDQDYADKAPILIAILKGAYVFQSDLSRAISIPHEIDFIKVSSYAGMQSTGKVKEEIAFKNYLKGRHVILVEDIVETGNTLQFLQTRAMEMEFASLKIVSLLLKPECLKTNVDFYQIGFEIPNDFVVGYGMDYNELGRDLKALYVLSE